MELDPELRIFITAALQQVITDLTDRLRGVKYGQPFFVVEIV